MSTPPSTLTLSIPDKQTNMIPCLLATTGARVMVGNIFDFIFERINLIVNLIGTTLNNDIQNLWYSNCYQCFQLWVFSLFATGFIMLSELKRERYTSGIVNGAYSTELVKNLVHHPNNWLEQKTKMPDMLWNIPKTATPNRPCE